MFTGCDVNAVIFLQVLSADVDKVIVFTYLQSTHIHSHHNTFLAPLPTTLNIISCLFLTFCLCVTLPLLTHFVNSP